MTFIKFKRRIHLLIQIFFLILSFNSYGNGVYGLKHEIDKSYSLEMDQLYGENYPSEKKKLTSKYNEFITPMAEKAVKILLNVDNDELTDDAKHAWNYLLQEYKNAKEENTNLQLGNFLLQFNTEALFKLGPVRDSFNSYRGQHRHDDLESVPEEYQRTQNTGSCCGLY